VASATNRTTLIAAVLPARSASTHTLFCLKTPLPLHAQHLLCALLNSLVVNYLVRRRVTTHVTTAIVERLPVPSVADLGPWAGVLADAGEHLAHGASDDVTVRMNARVAAVYQLSSAEFRHLLDTFPLVDARLRDRMLECFEAL
jgi:hypothetical protein